MTTIYCLNGLRIESNEFYMLDVGNNIHEVAIGEKILERASKEDGDSNWIVDGPLYENDLMEIIYSVGGTA